MKRLVPIFALLALFFYACGDGLEQKEETDALGFRVEYKVDPETGLKEGALRRYDPQGNLAIEENYLEGKLEGKRKVFTPEGKVIVEENYKADEFDGDYITYDSTGVISGKGQYIDGAMNRAWYRFYPNGKVQEVVTFVDNAENGPFREWYQNGQPKASGAYLNGDKEHGKLHLYTEAGQLERVMNCEVGVCNTIWSPDSTFVAPEGVDMTMPEVLK
ncbi:toxin-antitoxin system YwqK family antitoxin [Neolewinella aurantiaca]|uniref:Toxin-antitoxin system YwqK family antitoxin n=1 Tax=Neolewinella aurantiaca TaxID=2602767 RepID=A0A5C7FJB1_9BACT|nr:toxin-antitoxin system YwqK family antitoxin [Neolewinella aurantiaca]TXF91365.1 toxin-antitoxin system YwqK family antitoxin [Neolewinella aurantiaca]